MSGMQDKLDSSLLGGFQDAAEARERLKRIKELLRKEPEMIATGIVAIISYHMERWREQAAREWDVDIADLDGLKSAQLEEEYPLQGISFIEKMNLYCAFAEHLKRLDGYAAIRRYPEKNSL